ncbi:MAG: LysM peptidoglycan-binding domain-containing protein [Bacilli bacterium]|nr:LysM peptidoglycan-binding domain-containing protein [Bacilli bacterium]
MYKIYQVVNGDTIEGIAGRLGISVDTLVNLNGLAVGRELVPGSYIVIPKGEALFDKYVVQKGDNMYAIARNYGLNPMELVKLNGLNPNDIIYPGDEILIPKNDTGFYITESGDTLSKVLGALRLSLNDFTDQNQTIYLLPDQLIVYKK